MTSKLRAAFGAICLSAGLALTAVALPSATSAGETALQTRSSTARGNMALLVPVDSADIEERAEVDKTLVSALQHFGMPFDLLDLSKEKLTDEFLLGHSAIVIAQGGLGKHLKEEDVAAIAKAVERGVGLINLGGSLSSYPVAYLRALGIRLTETASAPSVRIASEPHPITAGQELGRKYELVRPVEMDAIEGPPGGEVLLQTDRGLPAAVALHLGKGRVVQFTLSPKFWLAGYFGHVHGLDGVFWKSIVWAARKPFVMLAMPPFVAARVDDASGSGSRHLVNEESAAKSFRYIEILNRHGYRPNVGLFTDDIRDEDGPVLRQAFEQGLAEFSAHAWTETRFIYIDRVRATKGKRMVEFSPEVLRQGFEKLDRQFANWGVKPSRTVNSHCFSPGVNALPFLKERGETFMMFSGKFGKDYYDPSAYTWDPKPYGDPGFTYDYMPGHPDFFNVQAHPYKVSKDGRINDGDIDILNGNTGYNHESPTNRLAAAAQKGAAAIELGLDSLFFGCLFAHEQRIASLTMGEWEKVLGDIDKLTAKGSRIFKGYDYISKYAKSRYDTRIAQADCDREARRIRLRVTGESTLPLKVYLFQGSGLEYQFRDISVFKGEESMTVAW